MRLLIYSLIVFGLFPAMISVGDADSNPLNKENSRIISSILSKLVDISTIKPISTENSDMISSIRIYENEENNYLKNPEEWKDQKSTQGTGRI